MLLPMLLFVLLVVTNSFVLGGMFVFFYLIAGLHDLFFVRYKKNQDSKAPYFVEVDKDEPK